MIAVASQVFARLGLVVAVNRRLHTDPRNVERLG
jgi:hypothetical protein